MEKRKKVVHSIVSVFCALFVLFVIPYMTANAADFNVGAASAQAIGLGTDVSGNITNDGTMTLDT